jgi:hypothetical protein
VPEVTSAGRSGRFDRVAKPEPGASRHRSHEGKEALYSTAPGAAPSSQVLVVCERCDIEKGISLLRSITLLKPPVLFNPVNKKLWARCPACERRSWLRVRKGQALRALLDRNPR